jgi:hypothetical protein
MMFKPRTSPGFRRAITICLLAFLGLAAAHAAEVYTWTDENGVVHYSDSPRAAGTMSTLQIEEIYRPGSADAYPPATPQAEAAEPASAETPAAEPESAASAAQQRREQLAAAREEQREEQAARDGLCARHRQRLEQMEPARRVFYTNEQGEEVRMDDDQRIALIEESRAFLAANCGS